MLEVKRINGNIEPTPSKKTKGSAGFDISYHGDVPITIPGTYQSWWDRFCDGPKNNFVMIPSNFEVKIPKGYVGLVCSRSGLAKKGIFVVNAPGIIDSDYRGEIKTVLGNMSKINYTVWPGERIAQLIIVKDGFPKQMEAKETMEFDVTERGKKGFGSTGY